MSSVASWYLGMFPVSNLQEHCVAALICLVLLSLKLCVVLPGIERMPSSSRIINTFSVSLGDTSHTLELTLDGCKFLLGRREREGNRGQRSYEGCFDGDN